jgi:hypothetical protein
MSTSQNQPSPCVPADDSSDSSRTCVNCPKTFRTAGANSPFGESVQLAAYVVPQSAAASSCRNRTPSIPSTTPLPSNRTVSVVLWAAVSSSHFSSGHSITTASSGFDPPFLLSHSHERVTSTSSFPAEAHAIPMVRSSADRLYSAPPSSLTAEQPETATPDTTRTSRRVSPLGWRASPRGESWSQGISLTSSTVSCT